MRPILLIMWIAFQSFILRHKNNNNNNKKDIRFFWTGSEKRIKLKGAISMRR